MIESFIVTVPALLIPAPLLVAMFPLTVEYVRFKVEAL